MRFLNWLIVGMTLLLALGPIAWNQVPAEIMRWRVAAAVNAILLDDQDLDEVQLKFENPEIQGALAGYYLIKRLDEQEESENAATGPDFPDLVRQLWISYPSVSQFSLDLSGRLVELGRFSDAVKVLSLLASKEDYEDAEFLNSLAYFRALAATDLDKALTDIDRALVLKAGSKASTAAYLDTRAWILYQIGKPKEALVDINKALELLEELERRNWLSWGLTQANEKQTEVSGQGDGSELEPLPQAEIDPYLWSKGVFRFHRAQILISLERSDEADEDLGWLRRHRIPADDRLY